MSYNICYVNIEKFESGNGSVTPPIPGGYYSYTTPPQFSHNFNLSKKNKKSDNDSL